jgi:hypothetical protein
VIINTRAASGFCIARKRAANAIYFIRSDSNTGPRPATNDTLICAAIGDSPRYIACHERPIAVRLANRERTKLHERVPALLKLGFKSFG